VRAARRKGLAERIQTALKRKCGLRIADCGIKKRIRDEGGRIKDEDGRMNGITVRGMSRIG
jgi:hypothetical protein